MSDGPAPWAAPDAAAEPEPDTGRPHPAARHPAARHPGAPDPRARAAPRVRPPLPAPPLALRPATVPDLLDGAFAVLRRRPRDVLTLAAVLVVPVEVVTVVLLRDVLGAEAVGGSPSDPTAVLAAGDAGAPIGATVVGLVIGTVSLVLLAGALAVLVDGWYRGRDVTPREALAVTARRSWALVLGALVVKVCEVVGLLGVGVGAYVAMALCHVVAPAVAVEGLGPLAALRRSASLTRRRFWVALAVPGLVAATSVAVSFGFQAVPEVATLVVPDGWDWLARSAGQIAGQLVVAPFTAGVAVLFHHDLRVRLEALDVELRSIELLGDPGA